MNTLNSIDPKRRCVPKTTGEHPGEWHEAGHSWIDQRTLGVVVSVRHLVTGDVSQVPLSDVVFGVDAEAWAADQLRAQELMVESKNPPKTETFSGVVVTLPVMCAWCRLWRVDSVWTAIAPANVSKVSHGICPPCSAKLLAEVAA